MKAEMMSPPWNNFLLSPLHFVVVRSGHDKGLGRISFRSVFPILQWLKEEGRHKKEESFSSPPVEMLAVVHWASILRPFAECLPVRSSI
jgi:hypothetical protein